MDVPLPRVNASATSQIMAQPSMEAVRPSSPLKLEKGEDGRLYLTGHIQEHAGRLRSLHGSFSNAKKAWVFPGHREAELREKLANLLWAPPTVLEAKTQVAGTVPAMLGTGLREAYEALPMCPPAEKPA